MSPLNSVHHHYHHCTIIQHSSPEYLPRGSQRRWRQGVSSLLKRAWNTLPSQHRLPQCKNRAYKALKKSYQWLFRPSYSTGKQVSPPLTAAKSFTTKAMQMTNSQPHKANFGSPSVVSKQPAIGFLSTDQAINQAPAGALLNAEPSDTPMMQGVTVKSAAVACGQVTQNSDELTFSPCSSLDEETHCAHSESSLGTEASTVAEHFDPQMSPEVMVKQSSVAHAPIARNDELPASHSSHLDEMSGHEHPEHALGSEASTVFAEHSDPQRMPGITVKPSPNAPAIASLEDESCLSSDSINQSTQTTVAVLDNLPEPTINGSSTTFSKKTAKGLGIAAAAIGLPIAISGAVGYGMYLLAFAHPVIFVALGCLAVGAAGYKAYHWVTRPEALSQRSIHE